MTKSRNILITGGTGLIGTHLSKMLRAKGHEVRILSRNPKNDSEYFWDYKKKEIDSRCLTGITDIIHLAGSPVSERWTQHNKEEMRSSRIDSALFLAEQCEMRDIRIETYISASGIHYYTSTTCTTIFTEKMGSLRDGFLSKLTVEWEESALHFKDIANKIYCVRTPMVLSGKGGAFPTLKNIASKNMASPIGSGKQWVPWVHLYDLCAAYLHILQYMPQEGPYNVVAKEEQNNAGMMKSIAKIMGKLYIPISVPELVISLVLGNVSNLVLEGSRASSQKLVESNFQFQFNSWEDALTDVLGKY